MFFHTGDNDRTHLPAIANRCPRLFLCLTGFVLFGLVVSLPMGMTAPKNESLPGRFLTTPVKLGPLEVTLTQRGLVDSAENVVVASECEWTTRIVALIPEGSWVEEGQVVVELDSSELTERLKEREILAIDAEADLIQAKEVLAMQEIENESALAKAKLAMRLAELDLQKYREGEYPKEEKEARAAVALAKEDLSRARERLKFVNRMVRKGYESPMAVENERIQLMKYENRLVNAEAALSLLTKHTQQRTLTALESAAEQARSSLERAEQIADIAIQNRQVRVHSYQRKFDAYEEYNERLRESIAGCTIRAPMTGEIIYANEGSIRNEILEGEYIRRRQEVVRMPDLTRMEVKLRIHEALIDGVRQGLPAKIKLDAYPDMQLFGQIESVSRVPTAGKDYNYDLKQYDATVRIDTDGVKIAELVPGLTAQVVVLVDRQEECLSVPAQSIVTVAGRPIVFVETPDGVVHREIEVGIASDTTVEVLSGLTEKEQVLLSPRTTCSDQLLALEESFAGSEADVTQIGG